MRIAFPRSTSASERAEQDRLNALHSLAILDTPPEERFDRLSRIAAFIADVPIAVISLVDAQRLWFKSCVGINLCAADRAASFCDTVIDQQQPLLVTDASIDQRFAHNAMVLDAPFVRFYAGFPLVVSNGHVLGTLCVLDGEPRELSAEQVTALKDLAAEVSEQLEFGVATAYAGAQAQAIEKDAEKLRKTRNFFRSILDACSEGIAVYEPQRTASGAVTDFILRDCNVSAAQSRALLKDQMLGRTLRELVPNVTTEMFDRYVSVVETGTPIQFVTHYVDENYDDWFRLSATRHSDGGLVILTSIITDEKQVEFKLRRSRDALETFAAAVSHDLRTPLGHISGFVELIAEDLGESLDPKNQEFMRYVVEGTEQMRRLIDAMQKHARLGQITVDRKPIDLAALLQDIVRRNDAALTQAGGIVNIEALPELSADRVLLDQLFSNLIGNSIRYHKPDQPLKISITSARQFNNLIIAVSDNGIGIAPELRKRVFNLFERGSAHSRDSEGLGIGLAMCRAIVEAHGGSIEIDDDYDAGTRFVVDLPLGKNLLPSAAQSA
ncbi:MAG: ATP-binding protein [Pseudomonadota bacterium]